MLGCLGASGAAVAGSYTFTDLNGPGRATYASGINNAGQVVGTIDTSSSAVNLSNVGFVWRNGVFRTLSNQNNGRPILFSPLSAINENGVAVGGAEYGNKAFAMRVPSGSDLIRRVVRESTTGPNNSAAASINNRDQIVGVVVNRDPGALYQRAFIQQAGVATLVLPAGRTQSQFVGINDTGTAVGNEFGFAAPLGFFTYDAGAVTQIAFPASHAGGGLFRGAASAIAEDGTVVGYVAFDVRGHVLSSAFEYRDGTFRFVLPPGSLESTGVAVNGQGFFGNADQGAFVRKGGTYYALRGPGGALATMHAVNANGDFVGSYQDATGATRAFVATCAAAQQPCTR